MSIQQISRIDMSGAYPAPVVVGPAPNLGPALIHAPGKYNYNGVVYDMTAQGFYSFLYAGATFDGGPRIVAASGAACDVERLMEACSWLTRYGRSDENYTPAQLTANVIRLRSAALRCGKTVEWARSICTTLGLQSRSVHFVTAEPFNNIDDGHVTIEVMSGGAWRLYDVPGDVAFSDPILDASSQRLSANAVIAAGVANVRTDRLAPSESAPTDWSGSQFQTEQYFNQVFRFGADAWRQRIYQCIGMVATNGEIWWKLPPGSPPDLAPRIEALTPAYKVKPPEVFDATFYP